MARECDAGYLLHYHTTKNVQCRFGTSSDLDVTITPEGYRQRDTTADMIYEALPRKGRQGADAMERWRVDVFTSPGRAYDSGLVLAEKLGILGVHVVVEADSLLSGYDLGPLAGMTLNEMRAYEQGDPQLLGASEKVLAYKLGFSGPLAIGRQSSEGHYHQVQLAVESAFAKSLDADLVLFIGNSSTTGVIEDWTEREAAFMETGIMPPASYRQPSIQRGVVRFFRAIVDDVVPLVPSDSAIDVSPRG